MKKRKVIITGRNYVFILGIVRSIKNKEYEIIVLSTENDKKSFKYYLKKLIRGQSIESASKYIDCYRVIGEDEDKIINTIIDDYSDSDEKSIIIPTDDYTLSILDNNYDRLKKSFYIPNIEHKQGSINLMLNKTNQKLLANNSGLNIAKEYKITIKDNIIEIPEDIVYPVFVKPQSSYKGTKDYMKKCDSKDQLLSYLNKISNVEKCPLIIEEYLDITSEYGVLGCSYDGKIFIPGIIQKIKIGKGSQKGVTLLGKNISMDNYPELLLKINTFISSMKFNGLFDVEIFESNGDFYFSEVNLRSGVYGYSWTYLGANLPELFVNCVLKKDIKQGKIIYDKVFVNERVCLGNYKGGLVSFKEYKSDLSSADFGFIYDEEDKKPYYCYKRQEIIERIMKFLKLK